MALGEHLDLGWATVRALGMAGLLHDLGKVCIPRDILVKPGKLTDATITMFCRLIALLFTKSKARQDRRHVDAPKETGRLLRMFSDTLRALAEANESERALAHKYLEDWLKKRRE